MVLEFDLRVSNDLASRQERRWIVSPCQQSRRNSCVSVLTKDKQSPGTTENFLGVKTSVDYVYLPSHVSGHTFGYPERSDKFLHSYDEWRGMLRSVLEAKDRLVAVELGAGWGPWLVAAAVAARQVGIYDIQLIGVEGLSEHVAFMSRHFADNGLSPSDHRIIHGIVGPNDGVARFPVADDPQSDWGAAATFGDSAPPDTVPLKCVSLPTLLADIERVDLLHIDIQGAEHNVVEAALSEMTRKVRRVVIGTHSRAIEDRLIGLFLSKGWKLEAETACTFRIEDGRPLLELDGTQVWLNPNPSGSSATPDSPRPFVRRWPDFMYAFAATRVGRIVRRIVRRLT